MTIRAFAFGERRWKVLALFLTTVILVVAGVLAVVAAGRKTAGPKAGLIRPLPPRMGDPSATRSYLVGPGAPLVDFWRSSAALATLPAEGAAAAAACRSVAGELDRGPSGQRRELVGLAAGVPDPGVGEAFIDDIGAKADLLRGCEVTAEHATDARGEVTDTHAFVGRVLEREGLR